MKFQCNSLCRTNSYMITRGADSLHQAPVREQQLFYFFLKPLQGNDTNPIMLPQRCFSSPFTVKALTCCRDPAGRDFCLQLLLWLNVWTGMCFGFSRSCRCGEQRGLAVARGACEAGHLEAIRLVAFLH